MSWPDIRRVVIRGRVQGVGFRAFVEDEALQRGVEGWVRNRRDGSVEAVFAGPKEIVDELIAACRRGPPAGRVGAIEEFAAGPEDVGQRYPGELFSMLRTA